MALPWIDRLSSQAGELALPVRVHPDRHHDGHAHDAPGLARLDAGGSYPQTGPIALDLSIEECTHALIEFAAQPVDLDHEGAAHA